jgi:hypothetical protein
LKVVSEPEPELYHKRQQSLHCLLQLVEELAATIWHVAQAIQSKKLFIRLPGIEQFSMTEMAVNIFLSSACFTYFDYREILYTERFYRNIVSNGNNLDVHVITTSCMLCLLYILH